MAREIIQMYDKYHSTKKVYPKVVEECLPEDIATKIENSTKVTANPTLAGTEAELTGLEVGDTKYKVPTPTTVVANPELAGTESDLEGLQVGETKYKIGGGKQLYQHNITINHTDGGLGSISLQIINDSDTAFTLSSLYNYIQTNFSNNSNKSGLSCNGIFNYGNTTYLCVSIFYYTTMSSIYINGVQIDGNWGNIYPVGFSLASTQASLQDVVLTL